MSEQQVRELAERLERADEEQHEESLGAMPAEPYLALAREALAYAGERAPNNKPPLSDEGLALELRLAGYGAEVAPWNTDTSGQEIWLHIARRARELLPAPGGAGKAPVTPPEPTTDPEATQVAEEPVDAATASTEGWRGKRLYRENYYVRTEDEDDQLVAVICPGKGFKGDGVTDYFIRLHNAALDRSAALPRERLASRWAELQADKEQLGRTVEWLAERLAWQKQLTRMARAERGFQEERLRVLRGSNRELAADLAQTAIERDELQQELRRCVGEANRKICRLLNRGGWSTAYVPLVASSVLGRRGPW